MEQPPSKERSLKDINIAYFCKISSSQGRSMGLCTSCMSLLTSAAALLQPSWNFASGHRLRGVGLLRYIGVVHCMCLQVQVGARASASLHTLDLSRWATEVKVPWLFCSGSVDMCHFITFLRLAHTIYVKTRYIPSYNKQVCYYLWMDGGCSITWEWWQLIFLRLSVVW